MIILVRVRMRLSFNDEESFKEAVESLRFNNPLSDQHIGSSNSMPLEDSERNEDNISPSDPITLRRVGSSSSIRETRRSGDIQVFLNNPQSNPKFTSIGTSAHV